MRVKRKAPSSPPPSPPQGDVFVVIVTRFRDDYKCRGDWSQVESTRTFSSFSKAQAWAASVMETFVLERQDDREGGERTSDDSERTEESLEARFERENLGENVPFLRSIMIERQTIDRDG